MKSDASPVLALHEMSLYNTGRLSPEQVVAAFAARGPLLDRMIADLAAEKPKGRPQHHLIVGQRGMGKTMLLARIAAELRRNDELAARFLPLVFAEEQYAVDRLSKFWLNCLDSLADASEWAGDPAAVEAIDREVERLTKMRALPAKEDQPFADEVYAVFAKAVATTGRRPVLLVDNLQIVFERLETGQQHSLRELLMRAGAPILVGASPSPPPQSQDYGAAFYDHFKTHYLRPLEESEMRELLLHLADRAEREDVRERVLRHPGRLKVLRQLTGGNPRTTLTLFFLYAEDFAPSVFGDLEGLLDRVTPLYKARFEELTDQQQVIASAIANHWDPVTAAIVAERTTLPPGTISAQLDRLEKSGTIERVELFGESRTGYQIAERFFNIWFLMRSASRRQRREVEFLTRFLESFYEPGERSRLARHLMGEGQVSPDRYLWRCAVADSLTELGTAEDLRRHTELLALRDDAAEARRRMRELIDFESLPPATLAFDELRRRLMALVPEGAGVEPEYFAETVLGDRSMFMSGERERIASRSGKLSHEEVASIVSSNATNRMVDLALWGSEDEEWLSQRLARGQIRSRYDALDWNRAFVQADRRGCIVLMLETLPNDSGIEITDEAFDRIASYWGPGQNATAWEWFLWAKNLHLKLLRPAEAEVAYREAIERDPTAFLSWVGFGGLLHHSLGRHAEAEMAYRKAIEIDNDHWMPWSELGHLLNVCLRRHDESEDSYRKAIQRDPNRAMTWFGLGNLLQNHESRYIEAENAFREALARDPSGAAIWIGLAILLQSRLARYEEAEAAYRQALSIDPKSSTAWNGMGILYCDIFGKFPEAASAYDRALEIEPGEEGALHNRLFLRRDFIGEGATSRILIAELPQQVQAEFPDTLHLHEALFCAYERNWGHVCESLSAAIVLRRDGFNSSNTDDWLRASAVLIHLNYGEQLLAFLDERGDTARLRPWVEAIRAVQIGDRRALQNVAPEIRTTAEVFYDGIERRLVKLPEKTNRRPKAPAKKARSRRK